MANLSKKNLVYIFIIFIFTLFIYNISINKIYSSPLNINNSPTSNSSKDTKANLLFVGDIMLDRHIRNKIQNHKSPEDFVNKFLNNLPEINKGFDLVVANLEGPITNNKSKTLLGNNKFSEELIFTFPLSSVNILKSLHIDIVSLANNHTDNFYYKGFLSTQNILDSNNLGYFGNPYNKDDKEQSIGKKICSNNICFAFLGYNEFNKNNNFIIIENAIKEFKKDKEIDFVIVFSHAGEEYKTTSNHFQKKMYRGFIDAGADLVIGAHPHVIQESEIYKNKYIYYSLGNYIFDQYFSKDVKSGLAVDFLFEKKYKDEKIERNIILQREIRTKSNAKEGVSYNL